jgi:hypothetical protein
MLCKAEPHTVDATSGVILALFHIEYSFCELPISPSRTYAESQGTQLSSLVKVVVVVVGLKPVLVFNQA